MRRSLDRSSYSRDHVREESLAGAVTPRLPRISAVGAKDRRCNAGRVDGLIAILRKALLSNFSNDLRHFVRRWRRQATQGAEANALYRRIRGLRGR